jgi:hypothetical protein
LPSPFRGVWRGCGSSGLSGFFGLSGSENETIQINQIDCLGTASSTRTRRPDHLQNDGFAHDFAVDLPARITEKAYDPNNLLDPINRYHPALRADRSKHSAELRVMD